MSPERAGAYGAEQEFEELVVTVEDLKHQLEYARELQRDHRGRLETLRQLLRESATLAATQAGQLADLRAEARKRATVNERLEAEILARSEETGQARGEVAKLGQQLQEVLRERQAQRGGEQQSRAAAAAAMVADVTAQAYSANLHQLERAIEVAQRALAAKSRALTQAQVLRDEITRENEHLRRQLVVFERSRERLHRMRGTLREVLESLASSPAAQEK